uniref:Uncharacterized protein n=1 Tax=Arundo donax TaxID=35708 RepID=A0A0A9AP27_ARUDO
MTLLSCEVLLLLYCKERHASGVTSSSCGHSDSHQISQSFLWPSTCLSQFLYCRYDCPVSVLPL